MSKINYQALREIAKLATQGEWVAFISPGKYGTYAVHTPDDNHHGDIVDWPGFDEQKNAENNARYIAAFNPEIVLALLDENERMCRDLMARNGEIDGLRKRVEELEALAKASPVASCIVEDGGMCVDGFSEYIGHSLPDGMHELYAAPPVPVVPEEISMASKLPLMSDQLMALGYVKGWNACRAAMRKGKGGA